MEYGLALFAGGHKPGLHHAVEVVVEDPWMLMSSPDAPSSILPPLPTLGCLRQSGAFETKGDGLVVEGGIAERWVELVDPACQIVARMGAEDDVGVEDGATGRLSS
jgi:hypothetical protein